MASQQDSFAAVLAGKVHVMLLHGGKMVVVVKGQPPLLIDLRAETIERLKPLEYQTSQPTVTFRHRTVLEPPVVMLTSGHPTTSPPRSKPRRTSGRKSTRRGRSR